MFVDLYRNGVGAPLGTQTNNPCQSQNLPNSSQSQNLRLEQEESNRAGLGVEEDNEMNEDEESDSIPPPLQLSPAGSAFSHWGLPGQSNANRGFESPAAQTGPHRRGSTRATTNSSPIKSGRRSTGSQASSTLEQHLTLFFDPSAQQMREHKSGMTQFYAMQL